MDEDPSNPVYLKKYAHLLQLNGDVKGAEEYYFRATMADPKDGATLMQYAKLVWELHHDQDRALGYFESADHAAPHDPANNKSISSMGDSMCDQWSCAEEKRSDESKDDGEDEGNRSRDIGEYKNNGGGR